MQQLPGIGVWQGTGTWGSRLGLCDPGGKDRALKAPRHGVPAGLSGEEQGWRGLALGWRAAALSPVVLAAR